MSTVDALATRLGNTWYHRLLLVGSFVGGFLFSTLVLRGQIVVGVLVLGLVTGSLVGLRFLTDRVLIDERERELSRTVTHYTFCVVNCVGGVLFLSAIVLEQLGALAITERMVGAGIAFVALFVVYLAVDVVVRWSA